MLAPNTILQDRYVVLRPVGKGGMGTVYQATDTRLDCTVALKEMLLTDVTMRKAFEREAQLLARLRHPNLPRVSDHFWEGDGQFLVMEFIPGDDLAELLARNGGQFPANDVLVWGLRWADQLLDALDYLHTQSVPIIHQDIKPQNLKLTARGDIILLDFGLARNVSAQTSTLTARHSVAVGGFTPNYAPLEQIRGAEPDPRSDLYSLAATLYHILTGVRPPDALTRAAALLNKTDDPLRPANELNVQIPAAVNAVLHAALSLNLDERPASAAVMRAALQAADVPASNRASNRRLSTITKNQHTVVTGTIVRSSNGTHITDPSVHSVVVPPATSRANLPALLPVHTQAQPQPAVALPGKLLRTIPTGSQLLALAFSPDGQLLATGGEDNAIGLWQTRTGDLLRTLEGPTGSIRSVTFSPNGYLLAAGGEDKTIRLWQVDRGQLIYTQSMLNSYAECLAFTPNGRLLASGGWGGAIDLWEVTEGYLQKVAALSTGFVHSIAFSPDGQILAAGCYDGTVRLWNVSERRLIRTLEGYPNFVHSVTFSPDGQRLAAGGGSPTILVWRMRDGRLLDTLEGHTNFVHSVAFNHDGQLLASGSEDKTVRLWRVSDGSLLHVLHEHTSGVMAVAFSPDGHMLASGSRDTKLRLWQVA